MKRFKFDTKELYETISSIKDVVCEVPVHFENKVMEIRALDPANVAMVSVKCSYIGRSKGDIIININNFCELLKSVLLVSPEKKIDLIIDERKQLLHVQNIDIMSSMFYIDVEKGLAKELELKGKRTVLIKKNKLQTLIKAFEIASDTIIFGLNEGMFYLKTDDGFSRLRLHVPNIVKTRAKSDIRSRYSMEYIKKALLGKHHVLRGSQLTIRFDDAYPLYIEDDLNNYFVLAPRVDDYE